MSVGIFNFIFLLIPIQSVAQSDANLRWQNYLKQVDKYKLKEKNQGLSYLVSGGLAVLSGLAATTTTTDPYEKGVYSMFQFIGITSLAYGYTQWSIEDDRFLVIHALEANELTSLQKEKILRFYVEQKKESEKRQKWVALATHSLIAGLSFYNSSQQTDTGLKNVLLATGSINLLMAISYSIDSIDY